MLTNWEQVCGKSRDLGFSNLSFYINVTKLPNSTRVKFHSLNSTKYRSSQRRCPVRKGVLRNFAKFTGKQLCQSLFLNKVAGLRPATLLKNTLAQVFSCEYCEIYKTTFFHRTPLVAASAQSHIVAMFVNSLFVRLWI